MLHDPWFQQTIGLIAFALNVWGNLELTKQGNRGHIIRLCANACWLVYSPLVGAWALMANHTVFAAINVLGFHRWRKIEAQRAPRVVVQNDVCEPVNACQTHGRCWTHSEWDKKDVS